MADFALGDYLLRSERDHASRPALEVGDRVLTYAELGLEARRLAAALVSHDPAGQRMAAFLAYRSVPAYTSVAGIHFAGRGYVPLNPSFPVERLRRIVELSGVTTILVAREGLDTLGELAALLTDPVCFIGVDVDETPSALAGSIHKFVPRAQIPSEGLAEPIAPEPTDLAYLLFTSGSTGAPKGVGITHSNATAFIDLMIDRFALTPEDRASQMFDQTFDVSVHDTFVTWGSGACLCVPTQRELMMPARFIVKSRLTTWYSVPAVPALMSRVRMLTPGRFPDLKRSLFAGEALPADLAHAWAEAAPNSIVENLYGPTEATVTVTAYRWDRGLGMAQARHGSCPIGYVNSNTEAVLLDADGKIVAGPGQGELLVGGPQVAPGYWKDALETAAKFVKLPETGDTVWYRTGDLVERAEDGCLTFLTRIDDQVKIRGYRIELQEIEAVLREGCGSAAAIALAWPVTAEGAQGIVGFVSCDEFDQEAAIEYCRLHVPEYMTPSKVINLAAFPLTSSGKVDRKALRALLDGGGQAAIMGDDDVRSRIGAAGSL